jgi:hypothetical protein
MRGGLSRSNFYLICSFVERWSCTLCSIPTEMYDVCRLYLLSCDAANHFTLVVVEPGRLDASSQRPGIN